MAAPMIETRILREPWEVDPVLIGLNLTRPGLLKVRTMALGAGADATPFHASNAAGTFAYHYGVYGLRDEFVGEHWRIDRPNGIEVICNDVKNTLVGFVNVDVACIDGHNPAPRSKKGSGAERVSQSMLFDYLPEYAPIPTSLRALYYLMVDENGAAELSRPVVRDEKFSTFIDRIYLSTGDDLDGTSRAFDDGDPAIDFDPQVVRRVG